MPVPVIVYVIADIAIKAGVWGWRAYNVYETAQTAREAAELAKSLAENREKLKAKFKEIVSSISDEIDVKSSTLALVDNGGNSTQSRRGNENTLWKEEIERKLPFRPAIGMVCMMALEAPITVPRRIRKKLPSGALGEAEIQVLLKQTTASIMFETIDSFLKWQSPLKAEPNYNMSTKAAYLGNPVTRPRRFGEIFPFWPRPAGSLAPDLVIVEYRQKSFEIDNVFAAVEIKFPNDWVKPKQMKDYVNLMTPTTGNDAEKVGKKKVALLRVPEDCTTSEKKKEAPDQREKPSNIKRKRR